MIQNCAYFIPIYALAGSLIYKALVGMAIALYIYSL